MFQKIVAFFTALIAFFSGLFGFIKNNDPPQPQPVPTEAYSASNVSYGPHERNIMDVSFPADDDGVMGLFLCIHGGGWIAGGKDVYAGMLPYLTAQGYAAATINYRYASASVHMNDMMDDVQAALDKIAGIAAEHGITISGALLTGTSAGAHMSLLYGYTRANSAAIPIKAIASFCGPTDLTDTDYIEHNDLGTLDGMIALNDWCSGTVILRSDYEAKNAAYDRFARRGNLL